MIHSIAHLCMILTKGFWCLPFFSSYILIGFLWSFRYGWKIGILASHNVAKSKTGPKEMQVIHFDQDCESVCNFKIFLILNIFGTPLNHESLFWMNAFYLKVWATFISFFLFLFFSSCFFGMASFHSLFFFSCSLAWKYFFITHTLFLAKQSILRDRFITQLMEFLFGGWKDMFCVTLSVRVSNFICGCTCVLIMGAWWESQQGSQQFDKAQCSNK